MASESDASESFVRSNLGPMPDAYNPAASWAFLREIGQESRLELVLFVLLCLLVSAGEALRWCVERLRRLGSIRTG